MSGGQPRTFAFRRRVIVVLCALGALAAGCTDATGVVAPGLDGSAASTTSITAADGTFAVDPDVRILTLANGLTVYLRHNETPGYNAEMRLVVNAGSVLETADQVGVAHFLEHMMFNGTTSRPGNELIDQLREFGMEFGADINASTSYDETVYQLSVPAGPGEGGASSPLASGLDILAEWLSAATLDPAEVEAEIGVVLDEWRGDQSFDGRLGASIADMYLNESAYHDHPPIGSAEAIEAMTSARLRDFYDAWYRPDNAAVVVVGDFDLDDVEAQVTERFGTLAARAAQPARPDTALRSYGEPAAVVFTDPDTSIAEVELALPGAAAAATTPAQLRDQVLDELAFDMLTTRLGDDVALGQATFSDAYGSDDDVVRGLDAPSVVVTAESDHVDDAIDALLREFERADRFGFSAAELERSTSSFLAQVEARYESRDSTSDADFAERYVRHFLNGDPVLEAAAERTALTDAYGSVTTDEVAAAFTKRYHASGSHLLVMAPDSMAAALPTAESLLDRLAARAALDVEPRADTAPVEDELMPAPGPVTEAESDELAADPYSFLDPVMLTFPNGARVVLNPTDISDGAVILEASSPGGLSLVADADVPEALRAVEVVTASGLGTLDPVQLDTVLSATSVEVYPYIDQTTETLSGTSTVDDAETMLQVIALYLSQPRFDQTALDQTVESWRPYLDDPTADPDTAVFATYSQVRFGNEPRYRVIPTPAELDGLDLATIERVWRDRFSSPSDWVFAITGDFDVDAMTDLVRRYIGSLSDDDRPPETAVDRQPPPPEGVVSKDVLAGSGQKATLSQVYDAPLAVDDLGRELVLADIVTGVISNRLTDRVREAMGASYSPYGYSAVYTDPDELVETVVEVTGDPAEIDELTSLVTTELDDLRATGPSASELDDALTAVQQSYDEFDDSSLALVLVRAAADPQVLDDFIARRDTLADVALGDVRSFIQRSLPANRYIQLRLLPA